MLPALERNLNGKGKNYLMPFLWLHGESEDVLRDMMAAVDGAGIGAVCVESRPHPDFAGPKWWSDMDVILDEARERGMKVWILDDSHFPTGFANGAIKNRDDSLRREGIVCETVPIEGKVEIPVEKYIHPKFEKNLYEQYTLGDLPTFSGDRILSLTARSAAGETIPLKNRIVDGVLRWEVPEGEWQLVFCLLSKNLGPHRDYINMISEKSCRVLLDAVYEPHWEHYKEDFGSTIAGFFSDEPELGNGHLYYFDDPIGSDIDLPWSDELEEELRSRLGSQMEILLPLLWDKSKIGADRDSVARVRYAYMDSVTRLVEKDFSLLLGNWCHDHGVEYIGHLIEDNDHHTRMGSSLGHYFRGLSGMDMAGIDDIGGQVLPQGEDIEIRGRIGQARDGEFYHYALAKLASSFAAIDPRKKGRSLCEIFGAYGWGEGVTLMKYLADHFMVRGVNHFVPHAFSSAPYPDPDCPPHFYAHGNNPQYRHFGQLARYMNRVCDIISSSERYAPIAILYHGEGEWTGEAIPVQKPLRVLLDRQMDADIIPADVFSETERYRTDLSDGLVINGRRYSALIVPGCEYASSDFAAACAKLAKSSYPVIFLDSLPRGLYDGDRKDEKSVIKELSACRIISLEGLSSELDALGLREISLSPESDRIRVLRLKGEAEALFVTNESAQVYDGMLSIPEPGPVYFYNAWDNRLETAEFKLSEDNTQVRIHLDPSASIFIFCGEEHTSEPLWNGTPREVIELKDSWKRRICKSIDYPNFGEPVSISLPDRLHKELPGFSGFARYETKFTGKAGKRSILEITGSCEGVEVFINGKSLGIQVIPLYRYELTDEITDGENLLVIEIASTLERENYEENSQNPFAPATPPTSPTGLAGEVRIYQY